MRQKHSRSKHSFEAIYQVVRLYHADGFTVARTAAATGIPRGTVTAYIRGEGSPLARAAYEQVERELSAAETSPFAPLERPGLDGDGQ